MRKAEQVMWDALHDKEYSPITGGADFTKLSAELAFDKSGGVVADGRVSVICLGVVADGRVSAICLGKSKASRVVLWPQYHNGIYPCPRI